ncbi:MAG: ATP-binding cassette domain-containing protein [Tannerellaceae bacterium]|nr:ATP-binding cassette domain-containing protein [Tannerellaceae bacterium]
MITIKDLNFYYQKTRPIFENVSFNMQSGIYGLLGENGVGKTTLLHIISGLQFPKKGSCQVLGFNSYDRNPDMLKELFFLPEEFQAPEASILDMAKYNATFYDNYSEVQLRAYLDEFEVEGDRKMPVLSTGQKKRL